ncbi:MAG TPA: signal peptidase I [Verrucomicrobiae bacterium]|jgi:signal peptidase|nr:signal peptidase I [Verrucomicrobiae bacterium]
MIRIHVQSSTYTRMVSFAARSAVLTLVVLLIAVAASLLTLRAHGEQLLSVQTGSMVPTFRPGDAVLVEPIAPHDLQAGDIISYQSLRDPSLIISHRLIRIDRSTGWLTTQGDALKTADPTFPPRLVIGRVTAVAPRLGFMLDVLRRPLGLLVLIYLPALLVIAAEAKRFVSHYNRVHYRLAGQERP